MSTTDDVRRVNPATGLPMEYDDDLDNRSSSGDEQLSEPELDNDLVDTNVKDVRSERAPDTQPATLIRCKVNRMYIIAKQFGIANFKRMKKAALYDVIFSAMSANTHCDTCNGQCDPSTHVLPAGCHRQVPDQDQGQGENCSSIFCWYFRYPARSQIR